MLLSWHRPPTKGAEVGVGPIRVTAARTPDIRLFSRQIAARPQNSSHSLCFIATFEHPVRKTKSAPVRRFVRVCLSPRGASPPGRQQCPFGCQARSGLPVLPPLLPVIRKSIILHQDTAAKPFGLSASGKRSLAIGSRRPSPNRACCKTVASAFRMDRGCGLAECLADSQFNPPRPPFC